VQEVQEGGHQRRQRNKLQQFKLQQWLLVQEVQEVQVLLVTSGDLQLPLPMRAAVPAAAQP
jgi:hypothetical protein